MSLLKVVFRFSLPNLPISIAEPAYLKPTQSRAWFSFRAKAEVVLGTSGTNRCIRRHTYCTMPEKKEFKRLPTDVKPENYTLRLQPDLDKFTFKGQETIDVKVDKLHCFYRRWTRTGFLIYWIFFCIKWFKVTFKAISAFRFQIKLQRILLH